MLAHGKPRKLNNAFIIKIYRNEKTSFSEALNLYFFYRRGHWQAARPILIASTLLNHAVLHLFKMLSAVNQFCE